MITWTNPYRCVGSRMVVMVPWVVSMVSTGCVMASYPFWMPVALVLMSVTLVWPTAGVGL